MKVQIKKLFQGRNSIVPILSLAALATISFWMTGQSRTVQKLSNFQYGLNTCFARVAQTYTAKLLGGNNTAYLNENFMATTSECFGESMRILGSVAKATEAQASLGELNNNITEFHAKIGEFESVMNLNPEKVVLSSLGARFSKLENAKDDVLDEVESQKNSLIAGLKQSSMYLYLFAFLSPFFVLLQFFYERRTEVEVNEIEGEATNRLKSEDIGQTTEVVKLVKRALAVQGFEATSELMDTFGAREQLAGRAPQPVKGISKKERRRRKNKNRKERNIVEIADTSSQSKYNEQIDRIWADGAEEKTATKPAPRTEKVQEIPHVSIEEVATKCLDTLSAKIFTQGIKLDVEIEDAQVYCQTEALEQVFYQLINSSIDGYDFSDPNKTLSIKTRRLGGTILVDFYDSARAFSDEFIKANAGIGVIDSSEYLDLIIAKELVKDFGARISFDNVSNEDGQTVGRKVQISLRALNKSKLVSLKKATKKELLKSMQS